jgi:asparagine synthase (glutamine-hydrolysing)
LADAAPALSERLSSGVGHRVAVVRRASCDLSGGLDSTSLAFLAAAAARSGPTSLVTVTRAPASPANDDRVWSAKALDALRSDHVRLDLEEQWLPYSRLSVPPPLDEPDASTVLLAPMRQLAAALARAGSEVHLAGNGGDQVLGAPMAYLGRLARQHPMLALRHLRGHRALVGLTGRSLAELARPGRYADWLALTAHRVEDGGRVPQTWASPWPPPSDLLTRDSLAAARSVLLEAAGQVEQVGDIVRHGAVVRIRHSAAVQRLHRDAAASLGYRLELPFLDADVAEICLAARPYERLDPYRPKPLLVAAMGGTVPDPLLARTTRGIYDTELHLGWRRHRDEVRTWFDGSRLVDRGLVTADRLAAVFDRHLDTAGLFALNEVLAAELWVRSLECSPADPRRPAAPHHAQDARRH